VVLGAHNPGQQSDPEAVYPRGRVCASGEGYVDGTGGAVMSPGAAARFSPRAIAGAEAGFDFKAHPHMLRHACGFALANGCVGSRLTTLVGLTLNRYCTSLAGLLSCEYRV
jgi:hypothetical protein